MARPFPTPLTLKLIGISIPMSSLINGPQAVVREVRKATPPTRRELVRGSLYVMAFVAVMVVIIGAADMFLSTAHEAFFTGGER